MGAEFQKAGMNTVTSTKGFTVEVKFAGGVEYHDSIGSVSIDTEWLVNPPRILIYHKRSDAMDPRLNEVYGNAQRALEFLGYRVETWVNE
jgi:hypothetical protein